MTASVLIVDDSLTIRMNLVEAFEAAGFDTLPCATLAEARAALTSQPVAMVVLDVVLPDGDGLELLREIRATQGSQAKPILLLSTEAEVKDRIRGLQTGADDYIGKPYDADYLVARACELLRPNRIEGETQTATVLVVDDSATSREELRRALGSAGYVTLLASSGEQALRMAAGSRPTAMIVDGMMPGMDGRAVIRRVRLDSALRGTPCVLLTGSEDSAAESTALDAGADAFVRKDEHMDVILARLAAVLRSAGTQRADAVSLSGPKRILAVDDSITYLNEVASLLRLEGYDVILARSGEEAIEMLAVQSVDCILLDLIMPGLDGTETCRQIKASPVVRDIPLIMLTAREDREALIEGLSTGADDFISKSSSFQVLKARLRAQLRRKQFEDETRKIRDDLMRSALEAAEERAARRLAEARAALVEQLERKNHELEAFSYSVSHDLRAPLRVIDGFALALEEDCARLLDDRGQAHLQRIRVSAQRMGELIDDLLELSRVNQADLSRVEVDLAGIAREIADELQSRDRGRTVSFEIPPRLMASADPRLMRVLLENLLGNAWKFTSKVSKPRIEIGAERHGPDPTFFVRDDGAGFAMKHAARLFSPFQRLHSEREFPGTGIGLATSYRIVDRHGGRIWAEGVEGEGATIFFTIPAADPSDLRA